MNLYKFYDKPKELTMWNKQYFTSSNGSKIWYLNGQRHREDGPAVELVNGTKYWYLNDEEYSKTEYNKLKGH